LGTTDITIKRFLGIAIVYWRFFVVILLFLLRSITLDIFLFLNCDFRIY
jgi:hypothetical protein